MLDKKALAKQITTDSYKMMGVVRKTKLRIKEQAQARAAIAVALSKHFNSSCIGSAIGKDRSTISYYKKLHEANLTGWTGYKHKFEAANQIAVSTFRVEDAKEQLTLLNKQLSYIRSRRDKLLEILKEDVLAEEHPRE